MIDIYIQLADKLMQRYSQALCHIHGILIFDKCQLCLMHDRKIAEGK